MAVPVLSASLSDDSRVLSIITSPQTTAWPVISLPTPTSNIDSSASLSPTMHLDLDASGCQAEWKSADAQKSVVAGCRTSICKLLAS